MLEIALILLDDLLITIDKRLKETAVIDLIRIKRTTNLFFPSEMLFKQLLVLLRISHR